MNAPDFSDLIASVQLELNDRNYIEKKKKHSVLTKDIGTLIAGENTSQELSLALEMHDIGSYFKQSKKNHAEFGYNLLCKVGISTPEILLPIRYHESDLDWEQKLKVDAMFSKLSDERKQQVKTYCRIVRDADILANMEEMCNISIDDTFVCEELLECFINKKIPIGININGAANKILYILCGFYLISCTESFRYLSCSNLINSLTSKILPAIAKLNKVSEIKTALTDIHKTCCANQISNMNLHLDRTKFKHLLTNISNATGYDVQTLEKDYFQTLLLHELSKKQDTGLNAYIEGSIALYKTINSTKRNSDDIDIIINEYEQKVSPSTLKQLAKSFISIPIDENSYQECTDNVIVNYNYISIVSDDTKSEPQKIIQIEATMIKEKIIVNTILVSPMIYLLSDTKERFYLSQNYNINPFNLKVLSTENIFKNKLYSLIKLIEQPKDMSCRLKLSKQLFDLSLLAQYASVNCSFDKTSKNKELVALLGIIERIENDDHLAEIFKLMQDTYNIRQADRVDYYTCLKALKIFCET